MGIELPSGGSARLGSDGSTDNQEQQAEDMKALRNGEYEFTGLDDVGKRHVMQYLWSERGMSVAEIAELLNVRENIVEPSLRYNGLMDGERPDWPPWKPRPREGRVQRTSGKRGTDGESGRSQSF